ncbi:carboxyl-terminal-processing peptidase 1, chloroplastic-like isoform X1 [Phragmites australis]|uniref:carboxyl-terminal-processing peptidase 1, chloroplastic-like isoform X1 n=1 Tax=Phragmites australis TaxID=29695 RepID=UPI002D7652C8|nr:carboxyl-terminal-processing peptidase 1, chloroplastic-like isoform X1 [Phragmites australis]
MRPLTHAPLAPQSRAKLSIPGRVPTAPPRALPFPDALRAAAAAAAVSLSLLTGDAAGAAVPQPTEVCRDGGAAVEEEVRAEAVTNEQLVEEAWEVVYESFLPDAGTRSWSPEMWMQRKQDILQGTIKSRSRAHDIIRKMLGSLGDPYTRFLSPSEFSKMSKYDMTGIGLNLREIPDDNGSFKLMVLGLLLDGPAYSAGVRQGDELLSVNGIDVRGKSAFDASSMLQGPKETFVTIKVKHGDCGPVESMKVQRQLIARTPVFYRLEKRENEDSSVGYIRIKEFNSVAKKDLVSALKHLQNSGASYFVLDLRDNLGGLVQAGIETAKLFLNKGDTVIYTAGRDRQVQNTIVAESGPLVATPLMLLVNNRTASASEIVASALHDNCKAVLVGERTFGKGLIQSVFELHDGSGIVVTVGKYVTPNHKDINGNGIEPDYNRLPDLTEARDYLSRCRIQELS